MSTRYCHAGSPVGPLLFVIDAEGRLTNLQMNRAHHSRIPQPDQAEDLRSFERASDQLDQYFAGERRSFTLDLAPQGTPFQLSVWKQLLYIPYGSTASYGEIARAIGRPGAARAVGHAIARNPIAIVVPCHRVIGSTGSLTGYAGGLERKRLLIDLEARHTPVTSARDLGTGHTPVTSNQLTA